MSEKRTGGEIVDIDASFRSLVDELALNRQTTSAEGFNYGKYPLDDPSLLIPIDKIYIETGEEDGKHHCIYLMYDGLMVYGLTCYENGQYWETVTEMRGSEEVDRERGQAAATNLLDYIQSARSGGKIGPLEPADEFVA